MKKKISVLLVAMITVLLTGCNNSKELTIKDTDKYLKKVMNSEVKFVNDEGKKVLFKDYKVLGMYDSSVSEYALIDLDDDKSNELVIKTNGENYGFVVLHIDDNEVYGYSLAPESFRDLKMDGSFNGISGATEVSYFTLEFNDNNEMLFRLRASVDDNNNKYVIDGNEINKEETDSFVASYNEKTNVEWTQA